MAKNFKQVLSALLAGLMVMSSAAGLVSATESEGSVKPNPINKYNDGLDANDQTNVTLSVPGDVDVLGSDIIYIVGSYASNDDGTPNVEGDVLISSLVETMEELVANGTHVNFGMVPFSSDDVVAMPLTKIDENNINELADMIADALATCESLYDAVNMENALIKSKKMFSESELADYPERQHLVMISSGFTYYFNSGENNEYVSTVPVNLYDRSGKTLSNELFYMNKAWQRARLDQTNTYAIPYGIVKEYEANSDKYDGVWDCYWSYIEKWVKADRAAGDDVVYEAATIESANFLNWYNSGKYSNNKTTFTYGGYGAVISEITQEEVAASNYVTMVPGANPVTNAAAGHAILYERAMYEAYEYAKANIIDTGINFYPIYNALKYQYTNGVKSDGTVNPNGVSYNYGITWTDQYIGHSFVDMLAGGEGKAVMYDKQGDKTFFDPIKDRILYYCSAGSTVVDFIGYEEGKGNFEFIKDANLITVKVGEDIYTTTQVATKDGYDFSLEFTAPGADKATFWLDYTYGDGKTTEKFVWTLGENVSRHNPASITYKLQLTEKSEAEGDYMIDTNISATLYPKDSNGNDRDPEIFPVPEVEYTVVNSTDIVIKKVDENGAPLTGAEFELFNAAGESLGNAAVDANGNLTFNGLQVGSYKLVETKTPEGYVGLNEPIFFEVVYANNQFAINMAEEYKLHFPATAYEISNHSYYPAIPQTFVLLNSKNADNWEYTTEYVFGQSDFEVVYCADSTTGTVDTTIYKNYALEDAFSAEVAGNLRAIIANSYPYVSMADMIKAATAAGVADAENLTRGDIIAAVQLAIWKYTNDADHTYRGTYSVMDYPRWGKVFHDYTDELPDYLPKNTTKTMQDTAGAARVEALYNYLVSLAPMSVEESPINAVCYIATDGKGVSQTLIGGAAFKGTTITVENRTKYDVDIVIALGAGIAQYDADSTKGTNTYDSIVSLVEPLVNQGINVKLGLVAVEHYDDVAMELTGLTKDNYKAIITEGLNKIQSMPAGPTNLHGNIVAAKKMLDDDTAVPAENKFFYVIATGRTYNFDNADGVPTTIINKVALKGNTYYYWGHYLWQSQRGGHTSLYMIPARYNNDFIAYWADVCKWVEADGDKYAYSFNDAYDVSNPQWFNTFYAANGTDAKALKLASSRFGWILGALTNSGLEAIGSGSNPQNALNYERAQYEAWKAYTAMNDAGYHCYALCSESTSYQNGSPYIQIAKYTGSSTIQLGHSFMNFLAGGNAPLLFVMTDPNTGASEMAKNFFVPVDTAMLVKANNGTENELPMFSTGPKKPAPEIIRQPENAVAAIGEKVVISVEAEGEGLTYQWFYMNKNGKGFAKSTFKNTTYTVTMAEYCHQRQVYCVITDAYGNTVTTNTVTIERPAKALTILAQPQDVIAAIGKKVTITVEADGDDLTYQWFYKEKNGKEFAQSSYTGKSYVVNMAEYCHQRQVYCVVTDAYGNTVTTDIATMARPAKELVILTQPQDVTAAIGEKVTITVEADGDGLTYQWFYKNKSGKTFAASSIKKKTYSVAMASYCNLREVYCVITDAYGNTVTTDTVTLILD